MFIVKINNYNMRFKLNKTHYLLIGNFTGIASNKWHMTSYEKTLAP